LAVDAPKHALDFRPAAADTRWRADPTVAIPAVKRSRPDFRAAARQRLFDERGVPHAVGGLVSPGAATAATVQVVSIDRLALAPDLEAGETDAALFAELIESIAALGVLAPILARPRSGADGGVLEILDGVRRWRAARAVGHTVVPVIVHEMDDDSAREFIALGRWRRPIPYHRLVPGSSAPSAEPRHPVVISGEDPRAGR
jgi:ParB family chromosome partitioning protein